MKEPKSVITYAGGGGPAEPVLSKQSVLTDGVKATAKGGEPAPVRVSETGRARNWTMPPLRLERECKERPNSATIDNRCVEFDRRENQRCAFTMAEILLSLTIIGVVAAITLPSLTGNINERTWNTQRKALYARFSQAIALMPSLNGYGTLTEESSAGADDAVDTAAETFVTNGLAKVLKINNICDYEHLADCGIPDKITTLKGDTISSFPTSMGGLNSAIISAAWSNYNGTGQIHSYSQLDTKAAAFETANGESIAVFYNPNCMTDLPSGIIQHAQHVTCANFVYDLNGTKGPNTVGKDIGFITALKSIDPIVVAPMPLVRDASTVNQFDASSQCKTMDSESRLPNMYELFSIFINRELVGMTSGVYWSAQLTAIGNSLYAKYVDIANGHTSGSTRTYTNKVRCIKR